MKNTFNFFFYSLITKYPTPINLNYNYNFGVLALLALAIQIFTGILAVMFYSNNISFSYDSIIRLMTEIDNGWLLRYVHANMASFFFIVIFLHIGRGIFYGSYKKPRSALWYSGIIILLLLIITAFLGYTLPWGQMSFWGATVITNFVSILPFIGSEALQWIWGGFSVSNPTLGKFFSLHYLLPFILFCFVLLHLYSLHKTGSSNPLGHAYHTDKIFFTPYYTQKDFFSVFIFLFAFTIICGQYPNYLGHSDNWIRANNLVTPTHIVPEWYFLLFYAILRAIPDKTAGVIFLLLSIITLIFFDTRTKIKNSRITTKKVSTLIFFATALILTNIGAKTLNTEFMKDLIYVVIFTYFSIIWFWHESKYPSVFFNFILIISCLCAAISFQQCFENSSLILNIPFTFHFDNFSLLSLLETIIRFIIFIISFIILFWVIIRIEDNKNLSFVFLVLFLLFLAFLKYNLAQEIAFLDMEFERTMAMDRLLDAERRWYENYLDICATENQKQWEIENAKLNHPWLSNIVCSIQSFIHDINKMMWNLSIQAYEESPRDYSRRVNWDNWHYFDSCKYNKPNSLYNFKYYYYGKSGKDIFSEIMAENACNLARANLDPSFFNRVGIDDALKKLLPTQFELLAHLNNMASADDARNMVNSKLDGMNLLHSRINKAGIVNNLLLENALSYIDQALNNSSQNTIEACEKHALFVDTCIEVQADILTRESHLINMLKATKDYKTLTTCRDQLSLLHDAEKWLREIAPQRFRSYLTAIRED